jgi:RNA polymerase sigma-70 factor (ECF subfamily)
VGEQTDRDSGRAWCEVYRCAGGAGGAGSGGAIDFAAIVRAYESGLLRYVRPLLGAHGSMVEAEDAVQETFLRLHRQVTRRGAASIDNLTSWLFRVAHNVSRDAGRRRRVRSDAAGQVAAAAARQADAVDEADQLTELAHREACDRAMAELEKLPESHRQVLLLRMTQNMTLREIGEVTGLTIGNVGYRINQGLAELSRRLKEAGVI